MKIDLLVKNCSELHTLKGPERPRTGNEMKDTGLIIDGALAVNEGKIIDVGKSHEIEKKYEARECFDATGKVVTPGFVDPHTHLAFAGSREDELVMKIEGKSYMEILESGGGILRTVRATRRSSKDELKRAMIKRMNTMLEHGTTTAEAKSGYGLDLKNEIKCLESIKELNQEHPLDLVPTYMGAHALPPEFDDHEAYINYCTETVLPIVVEKELAEFCDIFCEKGIFDVCQSRVLLTKAKELGLGLRVHADELANIGCSTLAGELSAVSTEHLVKTSEDDMMTMAENGVIGILLPGTPFMLMESEYSPARKMLEHGMAIALATDLNPNCCTESVPMMITLACLHMKMHPKEALTASTFNAAKAVGRNDIGAIEAGKKADIVVLDMPNILHLPYHFGVNPVERVYKKGRLVVDNNSDSKVSYF